jgi:hypothetical protein
MKAAGWYSTFYTWKWMVGCKATTWGLGGGGEFKERSRDTNSRSRTRRANGGV